MDVWSFVDFLYNPCMYVFCIGTVVRFLAGDSMVVLPTGSGLGLRFLASPELRARARIGDSIEAPLETITNDQGSTIYAFASWEERELFLVLIKVSGVGGKTAMALLGLGVDRLMQGIALEDIAILASAAGVGKKLAAKILVELRGSLPEIIPIGSASEAPLPRTPSTRIADTRHPDIIAIESSLIGMGYDKTRIRTSLERLPETCTKLDDRMRWVIKDLG